MTFGTVRRFVRGARSYKVFAVFCLVTGVRLDAQSLGRAAHIVLSDSDSVRVHLGGADTSITVFTSAGVFRLRADSSALAGWANAAAHLPAPAPGANGKPMMSAARLSATDGSGNAMQLVRLTADAWSPYQLAVSNGAWGYSNKISPDATARLLIALQGKAGEEPDTLIWVRDVVGAVSVDPGFRAAEAAPNNPRPKYPTHAEFVGADGAVTAQFIVGADGLARRESLLILRATHPLFSLSVREALPSMRFIPASRYGKKVDQVVVQTFEFKVP